MKFVIRVLAWFLTCFHHVSYAYTKFHIFEKKNPQPYLLLHACSAPYGLKAECLYVHRLLPFVIQASSPSAM
jgi:hypothetical protein